MKLLLVVVNLLVPIWATSLSKTNAGSRIIGGAFAKESEFKYQVSLRVGSYGIHNCGGSIIHPNWILTAGHCVEGFLSNPSILFVVAGSHYLDNSGYQYSISSIILHENYSHQEKAVFILENDVALLKLSAPIRMGPRVQAIKLEEKYIEYNHLAVISGWGFTNANRPIPSDVLKCATGKTKSCEYVNATKEKLNICVSPTGQVPGNVHKGDSGGPLVSKETSTQIGIASFIESSIFSQTDVYVRVSAYVDWIKKKIHPDKI